MWIYRLALSALLLQPAPTPGAGTAEVVTEVAQLRFYNAFWPNLHHTLYVAAIGDPTDRGSPASSPNR
jgi:hypothetical protein